MLGGAGQADSGIGLLISCRPRDGNPGSIERDLISRWFDCEDPDAVLGQVGIVQVTDFNDAELEEAASVLDGESGRRLLQFLATSDRLPMTTTTPAPTPELISRPVVDSLRHPVVWGAFASLPDADRCRALDADAGTLDRLADLFLTRFSRKCRIRRSWFGEAQADAALNVVARSTGTTPPFSRVRNWMPAAHGILNVAESEFLFGEAVTYGLIRRESPDLWRWRHQFIAERLAGRANS